MALIIILNLKNLLRFHSFLNLPGRLNRSDIQTLYFLADFWHLLLFVSAQKLTCSGVSLLENRH